MLPFKQEPKIIINATSRPSTPPELESLTPCWPVSVQVVPWSSQPNSRAACTFDPRARARFQLPLLALAHLFDFLRLRSSFRRLFPSRGQHLHRGGGNPRDVSCRPTSALVSDAKRGGSLLSSCSPAISRPAVQHLFRPPKTPTGRNANNAIKALHVRALHACRGPTPAVPLCIRESIAQASTK